MKDSQRKAIHASRKRATDKAKTLHKRIFLKPNGEHVVIEAKTERGAKLLKQVKNYKEFKRRSENTGR